MFVEEMTLLTTMPRKNEKILFFPCLRTFDKFKNESKKVSMKDLTYFLMAEVIFQCCCCCCCCCDILEELSKMLEDFGNFELK